MRNYIGLQAYLSYLGRFKPSFWTITVIYAVANLILATIPWMIGQLTQSLTTADGHIVFWTAMLVGASILHDVTWHGAELVYLRTFIARAHRFDDHIFEAVVRRDYSFFVDKFTGKISSYTTTLGREFRELLDEYFNQYINIFVALPIIGATMFSVNTYTGVIFVVCIVLMYLSGRVLARAAAKAEQTETDERSTMDGHVVDVVSNFVSLKAFGSERRESRRLYDKRHLLITAAGKSFFRDIMFWWGMSFFVRWIIWPATFILNVYLYTQGRIDLAQIATFLAVIVIFSNYIWEVIWSFSQLNIKLASVEEAYRYLFDERNIFRVAPQDGPGKLPASAFRKSLALKDVQFAYPDKPDVTVLRSLDLHVRRGEKIGVVGPSGGGKSTLLKLLLGYYPLQHGSMLLDGTTVDNRALTDLIAYVPQDTTIFHRSIRENIAYARPDATEDEIVTAAKHAQAHEFITSLQDGYDTLVGERGVKLSGGQRQRIAIARAILKDAPLLLLDEATSALDSESEQYIQKALWDLLRDRTAIVIAHRLSTIQKMDRIIVFDGGRIVEEGSHAQLLAAKGLYAKLWAHQSGGFIEE